MQTIEKEIEILKKRNIRVEQDKERETSTIRRIIIIILTYTVIVLFFYTAKLPQPRINAIVPTIGFILSTLGLTIFKNIWIKYKKK